MLGQYVIALHAFAVGDDVLKDFVDFADRFGIGDDSDVEINCKLGTLREYAGRAII